MDSIVKSIESLNEQIKTLSKIDEVIVSKISDGDHTFEELYRHRCLLFALLCNQNKGTAWKSKLHHDGTMFEDYFIVGLTTSYGNVSYHYRIKEWNLFKVMELTRAPQYNNEVNEQIMLMLINNE